MKAKSSVLSFRATMPTAAVKRGEDRRPTEAERAYVRAKARQAAQAIFEDERPWRHTDTPDLHSCE